jgi:hypothetical protein
MIRTVARAFDFAFGEAGYAFSDAAKVHLDPARHGLELRPAADGTYPLTANLWGRTPTLNPEAVRAWRGLDLEYATPVGPAGQAATSVRLRLYDGAVDRYWNGAAWAAAGAGNWNTLAEAQDHFATFPLTNRRLALTLGLATTNPTLTPRVARAALLYDVELGSGVEDAVLRTLLRALRERLRPEADVTVRWPGGVQYNFGSLDLEEPPGKDRAPVAAYDLTADPGLTTNLFASYVGGILTLTADPGAGHNVLLRVAYTPHVALATSPDFDEVAGLPAILGERVAEVLVGEGIGPEAAIRRSDHSAWSLGAPRQVRYEVGLRVVASRLLDLLRLGEALEASLRASPLVRSAALDVQYAVTVSEPLSLAPRTGEALVHEGGLALALRGVELWYRTPVAGAGVKRLVLGGDLAGAIE